MEFKYTTHEAFGGTYERYEYQSMIHMKNSNSKPEDFSSRDSRLACLSGGGSQRRCFPSVPTWSRQISRAEIIDTLWTKEHADTASYGRNWGYYVGLDNIRKYYVDRQQVWRCRHRHLPSLHHLHDRHCGRQQDRHR